ncbi:MAG TPA: hypothetical protein VIY30_01990, partial [Burkholderiaceae bacterium]
RRKRPVECRQRTASGVDTCSFNSEQRTLDRLGRQVLQSGLSEGTDGQPIIDRLRREIAVVLAGQQARDWFASYGLEPGDESPEAFAEQIRAEYARFGRLIHAAGIRVQ